MNAVAQKSQRFSLTTRNERDIVKARPFMGDHDAIVGKIIETQSKAHAETIKELAKI
jgi:hypothetical protein